jgi:hypothetical protein
MDFRRKTATVFWVCSMNGRVNCTSINILGTTANHLAFPKSLPSSSNCWTNMNEKDLFLHLNSTSFSDISISTCKQLNSNLLFDEIPSNSLHASARISIPEKNYQRKGLSRREMRRDLGRRERRKKKRSFKSLRRLNFYGRFINCAI